LEHDIRLTGSPYIVKSPHFSFYADEVIRRKDIVIDHILIPIRELTAAAESRRRVFRTSKSKMSVVQRLKRVVRPRDLPGGLWQTNSTKKGAQETALLQTIYSLGYAIANSNIPVTLMQYPRITYDSRYVFEKLKPLLGELDFDSFEAVYLRAVRPELVSSYSAQDK
jgi:hypothetical protein